MNSGATAGTRLLADRFTLFVDLGVIVVPSDYDHDTRLASFYGKYHEHFSYWHRYVTDANYPKPSRSLGPGDKLSALIFKQTAMGVGVNTTTEERMAFLDLQGATHIGPQGASLVWEQRRDQLPRGFWYTSFDKKEHLFEDVDGRHRIPELRVDDDGDFFFGLGAFEGIWFGSVRFESVWRDVDTFFCFHPVA